MTAHTSKTKDRFCFPTPSLKPSEGTEPWLQCAGPNHPRENYSHDSPPFFRGSFLPHAVARKKGGITPSGWRDASQRAQRR